MKKKISYRQLAKECALIASGKKAKQIHVIDVRKMTPFVEYYVVCSGRSSVHVSSIAQGIMRELKGKGVGAANREGVGLAQWVLLDYSGVMVHVFMEETRNYYKIEDLWKSAKKVEWKKKK